MSGVSMKADTNLNQVKQFSLSRRLYTSYNPKFCKYCLELLSWFLYGLVTVSAAAPLIRKDVSTSSLE